MINTWVRPKEWPTSSISPQSSCQPSAPGIQKGQVSTTAHTKPSQSHLPHPPQPPCKNGATESEAGIKKFQMNVKSMSKTSGVTVLPGNHFIVCKYYKTLSILR